MTNYVPETLLADLRDLAERQERPGATAKPAFQRMAEAGVCGWAIPEAFGGAALSSAEIMTGYEALAAENLCATFVLTQFNAAVGRLVQSENEELRGDLLPQFAAADQFATVGISHLTTSRRHLGEPAVKVEEREAGFVLSGTLPWCTAAGMADLILAGAELPDGRQLLTFLPTDAPGVTVADSPELLALTASATAAVTLDGVRVGRGAVVSGPVKEVMKQGSGGTGSVGTSALAIGHAAGTLRGLAAEAEKRPELRETLEPLQRERAALSADVQTIATATSADELPDGLTAQTVRARANSLCLRSAQAYLTASKGAGFVAGHPAGRFVREAMFFQVWSCPAPVAAAALREFACGL
ncbi:acyl-CoA dehydrogenase family protein [Alienimonas chondri]|uniref:Acyl-CoA dehydrogenase n=1 Tax=Alienimonas chondri TaxID=2681879 RepID=A0ABX1VE18_9PLAN|nr:acyl-CoA dehydrogenase family protein [Alienimonas chondri]NNJ25760.1 Acyl-CoA dehydrogenase [Alienimonas chondri]